MYTSKKTLSGRIPSSNESSELANLLVYSLTQFQLVADVLTSCFFIFNVVFYFVLVHLVCCFLPAAADAVLFILLIKFEGMVALKY